MVIDIGIGWDWTFLLDNPPNDSASGALSLDLYADGQFLQTLANEVPVALEASGSDSLVTSWRFDPTVPLATLDAGQSRIFSLVASATATANSIPEPGTLALMLGGLPVIGRTIRRRA